MPPRIWEMTAPGPRMADRPGMEQMMPSADDAQYQESGDGAEQGLEQCGEEGAEARAVDDTDQHGFDNGKNSG